MEMPKPTPQHDRLAAFAGTWEGDETLHPVPGVREEPHASRGRFVNRIVLDGLFLQNAYEQTQGGRVVFSGVGMYGFDVRGGTYTMHWFDRMGGAPETVVRGRFDGDVLTFAATAPFGQVRYVYTLHGPEEFGFAIATSKDGAAWTTFMEGRYRRVG